MHIITLVTLINNLANQKTHGCASYFQFYATADVLSERPSDAHGDRVLELSKWL